MRLPESIEAVIFRKQDKVTEFLIFRYNVTKGGFWANLTGGREEGEDLAGTLKRELKEETGITEKQIMRIIPDIHYHEWKDHSDTLIKEHFFGVEVDLKANVVLSPEHVEYLWCSAEKAKSMIKWEHMKEAIDRVMGIVG